jgi:hypothetical protein
MTLELTTTLNSIPVMQELFTFYLKSGLNSSSIHTKLREKARVFLGNQGDQKKQLLDYYREYTTDDFKFDSSFSEDSKYDFVVGFENFFIAVCAELKHLPVQVEFKGFSRLDSPPLEVYDFIGHNKIELKDDKINYSLLYK